MRHPLLLASIPICLALAGCASTASGTDEPAGMSLESIIGGTPATNYPEAAILNIDVPVGGGAYWACSATVIAPRVVLTAGHCVDGHSKWDVYNGSQHRVSTSAATYDWHESGATTVNPSHHDVGLVFLASDIVLSSYPTIATSPVADKTNIVNVGRIQNGAVTSSLYQASGPVTNGSSYGYPFDYGASDLIQAGDSGGPDFAAGTHTIVAVNSGAGGGIEVLARVDLVATWIAAQVALHPGGPSIPASVDAGHDASPPVPAVDAGHDAAPPSPPTVDAGHDAAPPSTPAAPTVDAGLDASPVPPAVVEAESNDSFATANAIGGTLMAGAVSPGTDTDWFRLPVPVGRTVVTLKATSDATFSAGTLSGNSCQPSLTGQSAVVATVSGSPGSMCIVVASAQHTLQAYTITVAH